MRLAPIYNELPEPQRGVLLSRLKNPWLVKARKDQIIPEHPGTHAIFTARGWGKTRSGAEWVQEITQTPRTKVLLVGLTIEAVRLHMTEGEAGILSVATGSGHEPAYRPASGKLEWPNGSVAYLACTEEPDRMRGLEAHFAWGDEFYRHNQMDYVDETWRNMNASVRLGAHPQILVTGFPHRNSFTELIYDKASSDNPYYTMVGTPLR
jgi:phage terminase large subunit-like protein